MDWLDGIFIAGVFGLGIVTATIHPNLSGIGINLSIVGIFIAPVIRRATIGPPKYPDPKQGILYSMSSLLGLLLVFFSMALFWLASAGFKYSYESMPDFRSEAVQEEQKIANLFSDVDIGVVVPIGTDPEKIKLLEIELKEQELAESNARIEESIERSTKRFEENKREQLNSGINLTKNALFVCFLGSILLRIRYPWRLGK